MASAQRKFITNAASSAAKHVGRKMMANPNTMYVAGQVGAAGVSFLATRAITIVVARFGAGKHVVNLASVLVTSALLGAALKMRSLKKYDIGMIVGSLAATIEQLLVAYGPRIAGLLSPAAASTLGAYEAQAYRAPRAPMRNDDIDVGNETDDDDYGSLGGGWDGA